MALHTPSRFLIAVARGGQSRGQVTYDLRRLRTHGHIEKIAHTHRYQVTETGLHTAMFLIRVHDRLLPTGLAQIAERSTPHRLRTVATASQRAIDDLTNATRLAS